MLVIEKLLLAFFILLKQKMHSPSCAVLIPYNLFRGMSFDYKKGTEYEAEDGVFWQRKDRINRAYDLC